MSTDATPGGWRDQTCRTCGHLGDNHDAGECWASVDGAQCPCGWLDLPAMDGVPNTVRVHVAEKAGADDQGESCPTCGCVTHFCLADCDCCPEHLTEGEPTGPRDTCRPVTLPDGEVIRVHGGEPMSPEGAAAMGELVAAVRRDMDAKEDA